MCVAYHQYSEEAAAKHLAAEMAEKSPAFLYMTQSYLSMCG
jgi:hypothetical protein